MSEFGALLRPGTTSAARTVTPKLASMVNMPSQAGQGAASTNALLHWMPSMQDRPVQPQYDTSWIAEARAKFDHPDMKATREDADYAVKMASVNAMNMAAAQQQQALWMHMATMNMAGGGAMRRGGGGAQIGGFGFHGGQLGGPTDGTARRHFWSRPPWMDAMLKASHATASARSPEQSASESKFYIDKFRDHIRDGQKEHAVPAYKGEAYDPEKLADNPVRVLGSGDMAMASWLMYCRSAALHLKDEGGKTTHTVVTHFEGDERDKLAAIFDQINQSKHGGKGSYELAAVHSGATDERQGGSLYGKQDMHTETAKLLARIIKKPQGLSEDEHFDAVRRDYGERLNKNSSSAEDIIRDMGEPSLLRSMFASGAVPRVGFYHNTPDKGLVHFSTDHPTAEGKYRRNN